MSLAAGDRNPWNEYALYRVTSPERIGALRARSVPEGCKDPELQGRADSGLQGSFALTTPKAGPLVRRSR